MMELDLNAMSLVHSALYYTAQALLLLSALVAGYRFLLHPLRNFPGPITAKFTSAYGAWFVWRRNLHLKTIELHDKYGPIVRIAPNRLIINSATAVQDIYNNSRVTKSRAYIQLRPDIHGPPNLLNTLDQKTHRQKRRIIGPVVSDRSMRIFEPEMSKQINTFLLQLLRSNQRNQSLNMSHCCERLGVDIVGQLAFGYELNTQIEPTHRAVVEGIKGRGQYATLYFFWERLRKLDWFLNKIRQFGRKDIMGMHSSIRTMIHARMAMPKDAQHDYYSQVSGDIAPGEPGLIGKDLWAEATFFIAAGGSTVATALSAIIFYLTHNPSIYTHLAHEIRSAFPTGPSIHSGPTLSSCKYLRAVIDETMRLSPSTLTHAWREQDPLSIAKGEVFTIDGTPIPPGTHVAVSNYALQHNAEYFPDPYAFRPERWLSDSASTSNSDPSLKNKAKMAAMRKAFIPFSVGDRGCAGKPMAYLEMSLVIAKTIWYFDFEHAGNAGEGGKEMSWGREKKGEFQLKEGVVVGHDGPDVRFKPRGEYWRDLVDSDIAGN